MTPQPRGRTRSVTLPRARTPRQIVPSFSRSRTAPIACSGIACVFSYFSLFSECARRRPPRKSSGSTSLLLWSHWLYLRGLASDSGTVRTFSGAESQIFTLPHLGHCARAFFPWGIFSQCGYGVHTICQALPKWSCRCSFISSSVDRVLQWPCFATPTLLHQQHAFYFM